MNASHKELLIKNRLILVRNLEVSELLFAYLMSEDIITVSMKETIMAETTTMGKAGRLLDLLPRRGPRAFRCFIRALIESSHDLLAQRLHPSLYAEVKQEVKEEMERELSAAKLEQLTPNDVQPQESEHLRGQQQQQQSLKSESLTNNSSIKNEKSSGRTNSPVQPTRNDERMEVETSVEQGNVSHAMQESGAESGNTAAGYGNSVAACGIFLRGSTGEGNGDIFGNIIDPARGGVGNTGVGIPVSDDQSLPGNSSSSGTAAATSGVTLSTRESPLGGEPMLTDEFWAQDITDEERNVVLKLEAELNNWTRNFTGTQSLIAEIGKLKPSRQVHSGLCLLITDDELRDNAAIDNIECLVKKLGFKSFQDLSVSLDSQANNEVIKNEVIKELDRQKKEVIEELDRQTISNYYDGLLVIVICRGVGDLKEKASRVAVVNDCLSIFKSQSSLSCLFNKPQLFFFNFSVERDTTSGSGIDEVDAQKASMVDDNVNAKENSSAVLKLESYSWTSNQPDLFPWVFVKSFLEASTGASFQSILNIINAFFRRRPLEVRGVNLKTNLRSDFTLTAK